MVLTNKKQFDKYVENTMIMVTKIIHYFQRRDTKRFQVLTTE